MDWLEDLFVLPAHQGKGIGTAVLGLAEGIVRTYSETLYIEVAAKNEGALRLYHKNGYDCLNTVTIRKDFRKDGHARVKKETIFDLDFEVEGD